jgi:uncharacterized protein with NRDE domain
MAAITNYRDPAVHRNGAPSRGLLVRDFLTGDIPAETYLEALSLTGERYNGFNLLLGDATGLWYYSNRGYDAVKLSPGLYGLSNHLLDTAWPKVEKGKAALKERIDNDRDLDVERLFKMLSDRTPAPRRQLPDTGVGQKWERILSPLFITSAAYGTRSSSVILLTASGMLTFWERSYRSVDGVETAADTRRHRIALPTENLP